MKFVNRISLIITPKQPMHQWLVDNGIDDIPSFIELSSESSCYLVKEPENELPIDQLLAQLIAEYSAQIWRSELSVWDEFADHTPILRDNDQFTQWFSVSLSGLTFDLADTALMVADVEGM